MPSDARPLCHTAALSGVRGRHRRPWGYPRNSRDRVSSSFLGARAGRDDPATFAIVLGHGAALASRQPASCAGTREDRIINRFTIVLATLLAGVLVATAAPVVSAAQGPIGVWRLKGNFKNAKGAPPTMVGLGGAGFESADVKGSTRKVLVFDPTVNPQGARIGNIPKAARTTYTVDILFEFDDTSSYNRIMSFGPNTVDRGLYVYNGGVNLYPHRDPSTPDVVVTPDTWARVRVTRNGRTKLVKVFVDGDKIHQYKDTKNLYRLRDGVSVLFVDDGGEHATGSVASVKLWKRAVAP